ncbi:hypothetical protein ACVNPS_04795 [Candidatus Bipolaricaulota sp. J31]
MRRMVGHRFVSAIWVLCSLLVLSVLAPAAEAGDGGIVFTTQVVAGTVGGALLGLAGFWGATWWCLASAEDAGPGALACFITGVYGYLIGLPLGTTLGVIASGMSFGVEGNALFAVLGAILGEALGIGLLSLIHDGTGGVDEATVAAALGLVPFASAVGATMGYHVDLSPRAIGLSRTFTAAAQDRLVALGLRGLGF